MQSDLSQRTFTTILHLKTYIHSMSNNSPSNIFQYSPSLLYTILLPPFAIPSIFLPTVLNPLFPTKKSYSKYCTSNNPVSWICQSSFNELSPRGKRVDITILYLPAGITVDCICQLFRVRSLEISLDGLEVKYSSDEERVG